jgi:PAS domain S-box-containing protein
MGEARNDDLHCAAGAPAGTGERSLLAVAETHFRLLVESVKDYAIFLLDPTGRVASWNTGARLIKGYGPEEILGKPIATFYSPEDRAAHKPQKLLEIATRDGRAEDEGWRVRKDGTLFWADVIITALRDPTGRLVGFAKVTRDLTARRAVEDRLRKAEMEERRAAEAHRQSEARLRLMIASIRDYAIFMLDPSGRVVSWNAGAERIEGYRAEEIIGSDFSVFFSPEDIALGKPRRELDIAVEEGRFEEEACRVRKDGSRFWANVVISAVRDATGELIGFTKVTRDLTERRKTDEERVRLAQAEEAMRLRDEFLSIASHELKTPLTALQLQLQSLLERSTSFDPKSANKLAKAASASERLGDLVESLLDVSRIATGQMSLRRETFDLCDAVQEVVERLRELAVQAGCDVSFSGSERIVGFWDRLRIEQIVTNLLSNAFKYAAGTPVSVTARRESDDAVLQVRDAGPGLPTSEVARLFGRFERASPSSYGGLGLGLYVARQVVEAHGGSIAAANNDGPGACVTVRLPRKPMAI